MDEKLTWDDQVQQILLSRFVPEMEETALDLLRLKPEHVFRFFPAFRIATSKSAIMKSGVRRQTVEPRTN